MGRSGPAAERLDNARCTFYNSLLECEDCVRGTPHRHKSRSGPPKEQRLFTGEEVIAGRAVFGAPRNGRKQKRAPPVSYVKSPLGQNCFTAGDETNTEVDDNDSVSLYLVIPLSLLTLSLVVYHLLRNVKLFFKPRFRRV